MSEPARGFDIDKYISEHPYTPPARPAPGPREPHRRAEASADRKVKAARAYLRTKPPAVEGHGGSNPTFGLAIDLVHGFALDRPDAFQLLREYSDTCQPPWTDEELNHKLDDAEARESPDDGKPRGWRLDNRNPAAQKEARKAGTFKLLTDEDGRPLAPPAAVAAAAAAVDHPKEGGGKKRREKPPKPRGEFFFGPPIPDAAKPEFGNFEMDYTREDSRGNPMKSAYGITTIDAMRTEIVGNWPKRIGRQLFVHGYDDKPIHLADASDFAAWIRWRANVRWAQGTDMVSMEVYFKHMQMHCEEYDSIDKYPHFPPIPEVYYMHEDLELYDHDTGKLQELVNMFNPATEHDRNLIKALICTMMWGGSNGKRPLFLITGKPDDEKQGLGIGKSTFTDILTQGFCGGHVEVSANCNIDDLKKRLLSEHFSRICRLDNVKSFRISWPELEGLITCDVISGHKMYVGEGRVPNRFLWLMTLNGVGLSRDMADRTVVLMLARPVYDPTWEESVRNFIERHKAEILSDVARIITAPAPADYKVATRWSEWERAILSKMPDAAAIRDLIVSRQQESDADSETKDDIATYFRQKARERASSVQGATEGHFVIIPRHVAAEWVSEATRAPHNTTGATRLLKTLNIPELIDARTERDRFWKWDMSQTPVARPQSLRFDVEGLD